MSTLEMRLQRATEIMRAAVASGECKSAVIGAASSRETLLLESASPADGSETAKPDSIYLLASITKTFFGTAFMQLAEQGKLLLTDPVVQYIPEFAVHGKSGVTIWHLLTHTSGLAEGPWLAVWQRRGPLNELIAAAVGAWLDFKPGTRYSYCNGAFWVLGELITRISGEFYPDYLRQHIFNRIGMTDTAFKFTGSQAERMMPVHTWETNGLVSGAQALDYYCDVAFGAGGLWSTVPDLLRYGQAHLNSLRGVEPALCSTGGTQVMTRWQTKGIADANGNPSYYGLGWGLDDGRGYCLGRGNGFGHGGATCTYFWVEPDLDLVFVFLTNMWAYVRRASQLALNVILAE
ncbi:MAG: serine hydrolase domain-containing protein [Anaerolineae bacterium]